MKKSSVKSIIIKVILSAFAVFVLFWFSLPALNFRSYEFWSFVMTSMFICVVINAFSTIVGLIKRLDRFTKGNTYIEDENHEKFSLKKFGKPFLVTAIVFGVLVVCTIVFNIVGAQLFNAERYRDLIVIKKGDFTQDVAELKMDQIPVVDKETAQNLGKRKLGEMSDFVSQFEIADNYTQINYKDQPYRVTPLSYGDPIKWLNNQKDGIPAYIRVNMTTQKTETVRLEQGIMYSESEYFMRNINRYLRFTHPTKIFDSVSFEIDESGTPFWVASTVEYKIGFWSGKDINGAVLVNAITGDNKYYSLEEIPTWVDQVYDSELIVEQLDLNGKYRNGFWNSVFGQKGVLQTTEGYNYLAINDDVWLYTGMTSVVSDESNVGFVLVNLRTKESKYYEVPGAKEYSAMNSAEGAVQEKGYSATFPLLLNVSDRPTYFMSLKDDAGLVKMYAFVDVQAYQVLGTGASIDIARENYIANLEKENIKVEHSTQVETQVIVSGTVKDVSSAVVNGNTKYYILIDVKTEGVSDVTPDVNVNVTEQKTIVADISLSDKLPFLKVGDKIEAIYNENQTKLKSITIK